MNHVAINNITFAHSRRSVRRLATWGLHALIFICSGVIAFLLRFDFHLDERTVQHLLFAIPVWILLKSLVQWVGRFDHDWWSNISMSDVVALAIVNLAGSGLSAAVIVSLGPADFPRSIYPLEFLICLHLTAGVRLAARVSRDRHGRHHERQGKKRVLIYGAGDAGALLLREIRLNPALYYDVRGFVDDDERKHHILVQRVPVLGGGSQLPEIVAKHLIAEVIIAIPSAGGAEMARILQRCHTAQVSCKTMPSLADWIDGAGAAAQIRSVAVEDLLGRNPVNLDEEQIRQKLEGKVVMVTGAAGSIGSELCRQIARFRPRAIVAFEIAETALFHLEAAMRKQFPGVSFAAEIGSVQDWRRIREVLERHRPSMLFHAAAYKHVPMMESHIFEAVQNNVCGTWCAAKAAAVCGVKEFVMISSDKAVRPTSVMGATKRVAELLIQSLECETQFISVRFGNVLGSAGSVVPIFQSQIAAGGPVTVTHPEMRRYFMTIPEAAQLVLQASTMGRGREIFVLDMGEPVKIVDLARNLILLSGLRPGIDVSIEFTGCRPGEKLYEEISDLNEDTVDTYHEKIRIFKGNGSPSDMLARSDRLRYLAESRDAKGLLLELKEIVPEYNPGAHLLRRVLGDTENACSAAV